MQSGVAQHTGALPCATASVGLAPVGRQMKWMKTRMQRDSRQRSHPSATVDWERLIRTVDRNLFENRPQPLSSAQARASTPETAHLRRR